MAFSHGRDTFFSVADSGGTPVDISTYLKDISHPISLDTPETTAFGSTVKTYVVGIKDARFSMQGMFEPTANTMLQGIYGFATARAFVYGPVGSTTGDPEFTGSCFLTTYNIQGSVGDMVAMSLEFQVSGTITPGTFS
jgi:hypothetical protein